MIFFLASLSHLKEQIKNHVLCQYRQSACTFRIGMQVAYVRPGRDCVSKYVGNKCNMSEFWIKMFGQRRKTIKRERDPQLGIILSLQVTLLVSELNRRLSSAKFSFFYF